jgi:hypothetical protein
MNIFEKLGKLLDSFDEYSSIDFDEITDGHKRTHRSVWYYSSPYKYRRGTKYLIITFKNCRTLYISYKWNIEEYIKEIVPVEYHSLLRNLMNNHYYKHKIE